MRKRQFQFNHILNVSGANFPEIPGRTIPSVPIPDLGIPFEVNHCFNSFLQIYTEHKPAIDHFSASLAIQAMYTIFVFIFRL